VKVFKLLIIALLLLVTIASATALNYNNETIKSDLTILTWRFNPDIQKDIYTNNFEPYIDIVEGCEDATIELFAILPIKGTTTNYYNETNCLTKENKTGTKINNTYPTYQDCTITTKSKTTSYSYEERFNLANTDVFMTKEMSFELIAKRKAKTGFQSCDLNFLFDEDNNPLTPPTDTKLDGKLWYNNSYGIKYQINLTEVTQAPYYPAKIVFNNSFIDMNDCQADGGDVRFVNATENGEIPYNISSWDGTTGIIYLNISLESNQTVYLYCNATITQTSTTQPLLNIELLNSIMFAYELDTSTGDAIDSINNCNLGEVNTVPSTIYGASNGARGVFASPNNFVDTSCGTTYTNNLTYTAWVYVNQTANNDEYVYDEYNTGGARSTSFIYESSTGNFEFASWSFGGARTPATIPIPMTVGQWYFVSGRYDATSGNQVVGVNNTFSSPVARGSEPTGNAVNYRISAAYADDIIIDEIYVWEEYLSDNYVEELYNEKMSFYPFYALPAASFGNSEDSVLTTILNTGLFNETYDNISITLEGSELFLWANYTYTNGTNVSNAYCNYTLFNISNENYSQTIGTNLTICTAGCDTNNYTVTFGNIDTDDYIKTVVKTKLCKNSPTINTFTIDTNCSISQTFSNNLIPLCSQGYANIIYETTTCGGKSDINVSLWSSSTTLSKALVVIDSFLGIDNFHNATNINMTWNPSLGVFLSEEFEQYKHGSYSAYINCYALNGSIENQSSTFVYTIANKKPNIFLDSIWWWLLTDPVVFTPSIQARYPLSNTINISGGCQDDDLASAGINLTYTANGTLIYQTNFLSSDNQVPSQVNFTQSNFSTETDYLDGILEYNFGGNCTDTTGNTSYIVRRFAAINDLPVVTWSNTSPVLIGGVPTVINWSVTDEELETTTCYLRQNGTLNVSGVGLVGHTVNVSVGTYNYSVVCQDSFRNSTQNDLLLSFSENCMPFVYGDIEDGGRYRELVKTIGVNCTNGISITNCWYHTNKYSWEEISNCSLFNITLQKGWNDLSIVVDDGFNTSSSFSVWATDPDSNVFDYVLLWVYFIALALFYSLAVLTGMGVFYAFGGFMGILIGFELVALSPWIGLVVGVAILIGSLTLLILKK